MHPQVSLAWRALVVAAGTIASVALLRKRRSPNEKERRRRELVSRQGRVIEGYVTGCESGSVHYGYQWRGVRYEASQDVADVPDALSGFEDYSGPVTVKFLSARPANSIVASETWSGIPKVVRRHIVAE